MTLRARLFAIILMPMATALPCRGQAYDPSRVSRKARALYELSLGKASDGNYRGALETVEQAIGIEPGFVEAWLSKAGLHGELRNYAAAAAAYERSFALDSLFTREYRLPYAINLGGLGRFSDAIPTLERFLQLPGLDERARRAASYRLDCFRLGDSLSRRTTASGYVFDAMNLGDSINSPFPEYYPSLTVDGRTLVFTRRNRGIDEDFLVARRDSTGWRLAGRLEGDINTSLNEGAQNISQDGEWLVFTGCNFPEGMGSCDLYLSFRTRQGGWSRPRNLGEAVNTEAWESAPCLSPDKRALYFASNRPGGMGGNDIWVSRRQPDGSWGEPENLGAPVNTAGNESCPFLHADGRTLYFTSDTHPGIGGDDLFVTHLRPDGGWDAIHNLGYPINTIGNEGSLVVAADGLTAYFASERGDAKGGLDIYSFHMRPDIAPRPTTWVQGRVFDARTGKGLPSAVELTDLVDGRLLSRVQTDEDGRYLVTLPAGSDYGFHVRRRGYLFHSGSFPLSQSPTASYTLDIPLRPIERDAVIELRNLYFPSGSASLAAASRGELDLLVQLLTENPTLRVRIEGHTDDVGTAQDNLALSNRRSATVVEHLVSKGIPRDRLSSQGFGASRPVTPNTSEEARARNRRTELRVVGL
jgi:outer membrane protein OmpA-like peptidoglycan-associated protein/tetratricopeptide (TPR) repeat protein